MQSNIISVDCSNGLRTLLSDAIFKQIPQINMARIIPYTFEKVFQPGELLYNSGQSADNLLYVLKGQVKLIANQGEIEFDCRRVGQEAATDFATYLTDAVAVSEVTAIIVPRKNLADILNTVPKLRAEFYFSLIKVLTNGGFNDDKDIARIAESTTSKEATVSIGNLLGWLVTIIAPASILYFGDNFGIDKNSLYFLAILSSSTTMWVFSLVDEYIPGIFAILASLAMQLVPISVVLSGLASDGFMLAMSMLGLSVIIVHSGLSYRVLLLLLKGLPNSPFWQNLSMLFLGFALTPLIPSANGRIALITPLMSDMMEILHQEPKGQAANKLSVSTFVGISLLSGIFLSSKSVNFVVLGLLPDQIQDQYQWVNWFIAAAVTGSTLLALHFLLDSIIFYGTTTPALSKAQVTTQLTVLGKLQHREWAGILGIVIFILGMVTISIHKVASAWIGLSILFSILTFGILNKKEFREKIDWPFLIYLGSIVGITSAISYLGLEKLIANALPWLGEYMRTNFYLFVLDLTVITFIIRLAVPISATIVILASVLMPVSVHYGVNPWIIGFIILVIGEMWFFPYQCSYYLQYRQLTKGRLFDERTFLLFNTLSNLSRLIAIYASIPYWRWLGLL